MLNIGHYLSLVTYGSKNGTNITYHQVELTWKTMRLDIHSSLLKLNVCLVVENAWILPEFNFSFLISTGEHKPVMIFFPMPKLLDPKFPAAHTDTF